MWILNWRMKNLNVTSKLMLIQSRSLVLQDQGTHADAELSILKIIELHFHLLRNEQTS